MLRDTRRFDCAVKQTSLGPGDYWIRSAPFVASGPVAVRTGSLWQRSATLWGVYGDGGIVRRDMDARGATRAVQLGAILQLDLPERAAPLTRLLWRIDGAANLRGILVGARVATPAESAQANLLFGALYAAFGGLCLALLVYNLALWGALRYHFQLVYCALLLALTLYAFSSSGALAWVFPQIENNTRLKINYLALAVSAVAALGFARTFFEAEVFSGWLARWCKIVAAMVLATAVLFVFASGWQIGFFDRLYAFSFLFLTMLSVPVLWRAWRRRSNYLWLFGYAWALPIMLAAVRIAANFNLVAWSFLLDNSTLFAMTAEALLSSVAIAYRIRVLSRERDEARLQEALARSLADRDPLTGLLNRRAFLREGIGRTGRQQLVIVDIDHFKAVNDTLGHDGGDEVLRTIARLLRAATPPEAVVARLGGEEFALLAAADPGVNIDALLSAIRAGRMPFDLRVTASLGVAEGPVADERDWKSLYRDADQALYAAKAAGRDRARITPSIPLAA